MHNRLLPVLLIAVAATGATPWNATAETLADGVLPSESAPIKRFMQVGPRLFRGGQPDDNGLRYLSKLGIRTVVSLRNDASERALVESLGMTFVHIPVTFRPMSGDMPRDAVNRFLAVVDNPEAGPVFVHCQRGADRTGAFVGLYRVLRQGWTADAAYSEARAIGMRWWYTSVKDQLISFSRAMQTMVPAAEGAAP
jgi:protein tyrosine/serine phosphatase